MAVTEYRVEVFNISDETFARRDAAVAAAQRALAAGQRATLEQREIGEWRTMDVPYRDA